MKSDSFLESAIPSPSSPNHQRRITSTVILGVFLISFAFLAVDFSSYSTATLQQSFGHKYEWLGQWVFESGSAPTVEATLLEAGRNTSVASSTTSKKADYGRYVWHDRLHNWSAANSNKRLVIVGDIHGMLQPLQNLLKAVKYTSDDVLLFVGDLVAKSGVDASLDTLNYIRQLKGATSVRGNHDQHVISWRAWMEHAADGKNVSSWDALKSKKKAKSLPEYPEDWEWQSEHFEIARQMSNDSADWLRQLPLSIYIPDLQAYVVHAGLLSTEAPIGDFELPDTELEDEEHAYRPSTRRNLTDADYPLHSRSKDIFMPSKADAKLLTSDPETAVLMQVQNRDPYVLTNMRGVSSSGSVPSRKGKHGKAWYKLWNKDMKKCQEKLSKRAEEDEAEREQLEDDVEDDQPSDEEEEVSDSDEEEDEDEAAPKPKRSCLRQNVIYGHWAADGLKIKDNTFGLDSACVNGKSMSAFIVGGSKKISKSKGVKIRTVDISDMNAQIVSVDCYTGTSQMDSRG